MPKYKKNNGTPLSTYTIAQCTRSQDAEAQLWTLDGSTGQITQGVFVLEIKLELASPSYRQNTIR